MITLTTPVLALVALIASGDPRAYEGPRETPTDQPELEAVEPAPSPRRRSPPLLPLAPVAPRPVEPRLTGRGLLIAGTIFSGAALLTSAFSTASVFAPCSGFCEPYGGLFGGLAAPAVWAIGVPMLAVGMERRSYDLSLRRWESHLPKKPARPGVFAGGLTMAIVGAGAIVVTWPFFFINSAVQVAAGPLAVAGAMMAGDARGRRLALDRRITVAPIVTRGTPMLTLVARW